MALVQGRTAAANGYGATGRRLSPASRGVGIILVASVLFGLMAVCVRTASREIPATQIAFVRFAGSFALLLLATRGQGLRPRPGNLPALLFRGLQGGVAVTLYYAGIQGAGAGVATLLQNTYPVFTALFAAMLMGERFSARLAAALALNFAGVAVILAPASGSPLTAGGLASLAAAVISGGAVATARHLRHTENAALITTYFMGVGMAITAPSLAGGVVAPSSTAVAALVLVVLTSVAGQWLLHHGLGYATATQGSLAGAMSVLTASAIEALTLGAQFQAHMLLGAVFMIVAVGLAASQSPGAAAPDPSGLTAVHPDGNG